MDFCAAALNLLNGNELVNCEIVDKILIELVEKLSEAQVIRGVRPFEVLICSFRALYCRLGAVGIDEEKKFTEN